MRVFDWPEKLIAYIAERENRRFEFGKRAHDCGSFGNGWLMLATGVDGMASLPDYRSRDEAEAILKATPLADLLDAALSRRASIGLAQRGDLGLITRDGRSTTVIVLGDEVAAPDLRGLERLPRSLLSAAWAVE